MGWHYAQLVSKAAWLSSDVPPTLPGSFEASRDVEPGIAMLLIKQLKVNRSCFDTVEVFHGWLIHRLLIIVKLETLRRYE